MTRQEQIAQEAINYAHRQDDEFVYGESEAFIAGAEWADSHPQWERIVKRLQEEITNDLRQDRMDELIAKACEWLDMYIDNYLFIDAEDKAGIKWDDFINDFRQAMEQ